MNLVKKIQDFGEGMRGGESNFAKVQIKFFFSRPFRDELHPGAVPMINLNLIGTVPTCNLHQEGTNP